VAQYDAADPVHARGVEKRQGADHIIAIIFGWVGDGFADIGEGREMHDGRRLVALHHLGEALGIKDIAFLERPPFDGTFMPVHQAVIRHRRVTSRSQCLAGMGADITRTACNKDGFAVRHQRASPLDRRSSK
jgi:hypothetical protein